MNVEICTRSENWDTEAKRSRALGKRLKEQVAYLKKAKQELDAKSS